MTVLEKDDRREGERTGLTEFIEVPWKHSNEQAEAKPEQTDQWRKIASGRRSAEIIHAANPGRSREWTISLTSHVGHRDTYGEGWGAVPGWFPFDSV